MKNLDTIRQFLKNKGAQAIKENFVTMILETMFLKIGFGGLILVQPKTCPKTKICLRNMNQ